MAYDFNGSSQYLTTSTVPTTSVPLTMCAWFNTDDVTNQTTIMSLGNNGANGYYRLAVLGTDVSDPFSAQKVPDGGGGVFPTVGTVNAGQWHHGAGVYASTTSVIPYLDGVAGTEATTSVTDPTADFFSIGVLRRSGLVQYFNGRIADAAVWSAALSADEIAALAKGYSPRLIRPASLIFYNDLIRDLNRPYIGPTLTATGSPTVADHPRIIYPSRATIGAPTAATGNTYTGTIAATLPALTASASGWVEATGAGVATLPSLTAAAQGALTFTGTAAGTLPSLTADAAGTFAAAGDFTGTIAATLPALTATASGALTFSGAVEAILPALNADLSGWAEVTGTIGATLPSLTASGVGEGGIVVPDATRPPAGGGKGGGRYTRRGKKQRIILPNGAHMWVWPDEIPDILARFTADMRTDLEEVNPGPIASEQADFDDLEPEKPVSAQEDKLGSLLLEARAKAEAAMSAIQDAARMEALALAAKAAARRRKKKRLLLL